MLKIRLREFRAKLPAIARYFSFGCLTVLTLTGAAYGIRVQQEWEQAGRCLAENIYHEARGESREAKYIVGMLTIARVSDPDPQWPKTICGAVAQKHQFSWVLNYQLATTRDDNAQWLESQKIAEDLLPNAWSKYVLPHGWECARWYKRTDGKGVSKVGAKEFDAHLFPVGMFDHHSAFQARRGCKTPLPTN